MKSPLRKNKSLLWIGLLVLVAMIAIVLFLWQHYSIQMPILPSASTSGDITYKFRSVNSPGVTDNIPYITGYPNVFTEQKVNKQIDQELGTCLEGTSDDDLRQQFVDLNPDKAAQVDNMSREEIVTELGWDAYIETNVTYAKHDLFSFNYSGYDRCETNNIILDEQASTFDLKTGERIKFSQLFSNLDANKLKIAKILNTAYVAQVRMEARKTNDPSSYDACLTIADPSVQGSFWETFTQSDLDYYLTDSGIVIVPFFTRATDFCDIETPVSLEQLKPYLVPGGILSRIPAPMPIAGTYHAEHGVGKLTVTSVDPTHIHITGSTILPGQGNSADQATIDAKSGTLNATLVLQNNMAHYVSKSDPACTLDFTFANGDIVTVDGGDQCDATVANFAEVYHKQ